MSRDRLVVIGGDAAGMSAATLARAVWAGMTPDELSGVDLSYAPPYSPSYAPVTVAARVASRVERG